MTGQGTASEEFDGAAFAAAFARGDAALTAALEAVAALGDALPPGFDADDVLAALRAERRSGRVLEIVVEDGDHLRPVQVRPPPFRSAVGAVAAALRMVAAEFKCIQMPPAINIEELEELVAAAKAEEMQARAGLVEAQAGLKRLEAEYQRVLQAVWRHPNLAEKAITDRQNRVVGHYVWAVRR
jgi:hypothetical protein